MATKLCRNVQIRIILKVTKFRCIGANTTKVMQKRNGRGGHINNYLGINLIY